LTKSEANKGESTPRDTLRMMQATKAIARELKCEDKDGLTFQ